MKALKSVVPAPAREWARHLRQYRIAATAWRSLLEAEAGPRFERIPDGPAASPEVVSKTALMKKGDLAYKSKARVFFSTGMNAMADFVRAAKGAGLDLSKTESAFELGVGGARLIRHLRGVKDLRLVASDLIQENIDWCRANVPDIQLERNELQPPLTFLEDESIDFAFAYSVFTHIPMDLQRPWIAELRRVLRPGGIATVTVLGEAMAKKMMNGEEFDQFLAAGEFTMGPEHPHVSESSALIGSWDVFMTDERVRETFGPEMEVLDGGNGPQSTVTLRKR